MLGLYGTYGPAGGGRTKDKVSTVVVGLSGSSLIQGEGVRETIVQEVVEALGIRVKVERREGRS